MEIDIQVQLRGPLAYRLAMEAVRNGEEPVTLLSRSVERMIERGALDTADNSRPPRILDIADFWIASAALSVSQGTNE